MNIAAFIRYLFLIRKYRNSRYRALFQTIYKNSCQKIVEIGVFDGKHTVQMIQTALIHHSKQKINYFGFDLFEDLSEEMFKKEFSKKPLSYSVIKQKLEKTGVKISLFRGNTKSSLPLAINEIGKADFIFVDGGHSEDTIQSDWKNVKELMSENTIIIFDDYYIDKTSELDGAGCNAVIDNLDREMYDVNILEKMDVFKKDWGNQKIKMVTVKKRDK